MNFLKLYRKYKDVFIKPKLKWYFGPWKNEPNLPVWRHGPCIHLSRKNGWNSKSGKYYSPKVRESVFAGYSDKEYNGHKIKCYEWSEHKLPNGLTEWDFVWNRNVRKKLRKWHLSWIPPVIELPIWCTFRFDDYDIMYKSKWDEWRYEYPAHIGIVLFGFAISVTAYIPNINGFTTQDDYWETMLNWRDNQNLDDLNDLMGKWHTVNTGETRFRVHPDFFKEPYRSRLRIIQNEEFSSNSK